MKFPKWTKGRSSCPQRKGYRVLYHSLSNGYCSYLYGWILKAGGNITLFPGRLTNGAQAVKNNFEEEPASVTVSSLPLAYHNKSFARFDLKPVLVMPFRAIIHSGRRNLYQQINKQKFSRISSQKVLQMLKKRGGPCLMNDCITYARSCCGRRPFSFCNSFLIL